MGQSVNLVAPMATGDLCHLRDTSVAVYCSPLRYSAEVWICAVA